MALTTSRLRLRPFERSDADRVLGLAGDWAVARMLGDVGYPLTLSAAERYVRRQRGEVSFAMEMDGTLIGAVSYYRTERATAELGFWLGRAWWGQGLALEGTGAVVRNAFAHSRLAAFTSGHFHDNPSSKRVLARLGFVPTECANVWCKSRGAWVSSTRYRLDRPAEALTRGRARSWFARCTGA